MVQIGGIRFVALGDWGDDNEHQYKTAKAMSEWCQQEGCDFIISTGDNFYPRGVTSPDDPRFDTTWRQVYNLPGIDNKEWLVALGNHDYHIDDREAYQVEFSKKEPRWYLPHFWYDRTFCQGDTNLHVIVLDSMAHIIKKSNYKKQLDWLEETLKNSTATWKIVVFHHPPYSGGSIEDRDLCLRYDIVPILEKYQVDICLHGHHHSLQHVNRTSPDGSGKDMDYVISGAGGMVLHAKKVADEKNLNNIGYSLRFIKESFGFVAFEILDNHMTVRFLGSGNGSEVVYQFQRSKKINFINCLQQ